MFIGLLRACKRRGFGDSLTSNSKGPIKCVSLNNRPCEARLTLIDINSNKSLFYPFTVCANKCGGSCNTIYNLYTWDFGLNKAKNMNTKVFNLMFGVNETRFLVQH